MGLFKSKQSNEHFIVATTHLYFMNEPIRFAQAQACLEECSGFITKCNKALGLPEDNVFPFVITGDFNAKPASSAGSIFAYETKIEDGNQGEAMYKLPADMDATKRANMLKT